MIKKVKMTTEKLPMSKWRKIRFFKPLFHLEFISDPPDGGQTPGIVILDLFPQPCDMNIYRAGIPDIFIAPDMIQKLLSGKYLIW